MPFDDNFYKQKKNSNKSKDKELVFWTIISGFVSIFILMVLFVVTTDLVSKVSNEISRMAKSSHYEPTLPFAPKKQTILLIGVDGSVHNSNTFKGVRSDTLILLNIDPSSADVNALSVPRDSKVFISNHKGVDKINHAFASGGAKLTIKTIEDTLGINIDHYIAVNYNALKEVVGAVDGVPVYITKNLYYKDKTANLTINLKKGHHTLSPDEAEQYVRFRHDRMADIGRMQRQQVFLRGLAKKFQSAVIIPKIPEIVRIVNNNVLTDMSLFELSELAAYARGINFNKLQIATLPGNPSRKGRVSYWILHPEEVQTIVDRLIYRIDKKPRTKGLTVGIAYDKKAIPKTIKIIKRLKAAGYKIRCTSKISNGRDKIISHSNYVTLKTADYLKQRISPIRMSPFIISPEGYVCGKTDFSIVVTGN